MGEPSSKSSYNPDASAGSPSTAAEEISCCGAALEKGPPAATSHKPSPCCQVVGCTADLTSNYLQRYRVCRAHHQAPVVLLDCGERRFCQQCGRFQPLEDFDGAKRSCRARLAQHNQRRRKAAAAAGVDQEEEMAAVKVEPQDPVPSDSVAPSFESKHGACSPTPAPAASDAPSCDVKMAPPSPHSSKPPSPLPRQCTLTAPLHICQALGCTADLAGARSYLRRYRVCNQHYRAPVVTLPDGQRRFCQQCGRFQPLDDFDPNRRSCREGLKAHNVARRRQGSAGDAMAAAPKRSGGDACLLEDVSRPVKRPRRRPAALLLASDKDDDASRLSASALTSHGSSSLSKGTAACLPVLAEQLSTSTDNSSWTSEALAPLTSLYEPRLAALPSFLAPSSTAAPLHDAALSFAPLSARLFLPDVPLATEPAGLSSEHLDLPILPLQPALQPLQLQSEGIACLPWAPPPPVHAPGSPLPLDIEQDLHDAFAVSSVFATAGPSWDQGDAAALSAAVPPLIAAAGTLALPEQTHFPWRMSAVLPPPLGLDLSLHL